MIIITIKIAPKAILVKLDYHINEWILIQLGNYAISIQTLLLDDSAPVSLDI